MIATVSIFTLPKGIAMFTITVCFVLLLQSVQFPSLADTPATSHTPEEIAAVPKLVEDAAKRLAERKYAEAADLFERAAAINPVDGSVWKGLADAQYGAKSYAKAIENYEKAGTLGADYKFVAPYNIACCYALMGKREKALNSLEKAFAAGYRFIDQTAKDEDLKSLRNEPRFIRLVAGDDVSKMSRDEGWRYDLRLLHREITRIHYNSYRVTPKQAMDAFVRKLEAEIPRLTDPQITVRLMELMKMPGDAHTALRPPTLRGPDARNAPIQLFLFTEGLFVTAAAPDHSDLAGAEVLRIGGHPIDAVMKALDPVISQDNAIWPTNIAPKLMINPVILNGLGLIPTAESIPYRIRDTKGVERDVTLSPAPGEPTDAWILARDKVHPPLYLKNPAPHWFEYLPEQKLLYCQYGAVQDQPGQTVAQFFEKVFQAVDSNGAERLVLDMRRNGGGNLFLNQPLIQALIRHESLFKTGRLFVIIGRATFSAAVSCIGKIDANTNAIFVGEPAGSPPNFVGETIPVRLPYSKLSGSISDLYWQNTVAMDYRTWIAPALYAPPSFALLKAGRDPAMEAILAYIKVAPTG